jgi:hypothetical protein
MIPDLIDAIHRYTEAVRRREVKPTCNLCPRCHEEPDEFRLHDRRERSFLVVAGRVVKRVISLLSRWKCTLCKLTFILYPPFALPRKRYVRDCVFELAEWYLDDDELSYREAVEVEGMPVFRDRRDDGSIDERSLSHSTLYRWLPCFCLFSATFAEAMRLLRVSAAPTDLFRKVFAVAPRKYRSEERRSVLAAALRALSSEREYHVLFGRSIFPELATACAWR